MSYRKITLIVLLGIFLSYGGNINAQIDSVFKATGSGQSGTIQHFTVPVCVSALTITAYGASGGASGGLGAKIQGTFNLPAGTALNILVGQSGGSNDGSHGSGGGGSYVVLTNNDTILVIAGGGGGHGASGIDATSNGSATRIGQSGAGSGTAATGGGGGAAASGAAGGVGCNSGSPAGGSTWAGGGGGFCGNGGMYNSNASYGGYSFMAGGLGGTPATGANAYGGFGGGSGAGDRGGGGGGYSGGAGGTSNSVGGGGGGSYNSGTSQVNTSGVQSGNGMVTIAWTNYNVPVTDTAKVLVNEITCNGQTGKAYAKVTGVALTYLWKPGGQTTDTATGLSAGNYTVSVSSPCGVSVSSSVTITQPANVITASATVLANASCAGVSNGSANVTITGVGTPYIYTWTPGGQSNATAVGLSAGVYTVKIVNACAATASASVTITQPAPLAMTASTTANVACFGQNGGSGYAVANSGTPPYNFTWSPSGGTLDTAVGLVAGTYTVSLVDNNGCTGSAKTTVTQPAVLTTSASTVTNVLCNGSGTGSTMSTTNGGTTPYIYSWTGGETSANATGLKAGMYTVNITDAHGCSTSASITITQPPAVKVISNSTLDSGSCTGSAWVVVTGGILPYTYAWSNGNTSYYIPDQCGTKDYCCTITDGNGCVDSVCINIYSVAGIGSIQGNDNKITIYPNPNSGEFTITANGQQLMANSYIEIYNVLGENVYTTKLEGTQGGSKTINISNEPNGIYLYRVMSGANGSLLGEGKIVLTK